MDSDYDPNLVTLELKVRIPKAIVSAMGTEVIKEALIDFIEEGEGIEFLKEQHEDRTGKWIET